ncbi:Ankyrin Repeat Protein, variant 2 [Perkinsus olseni]|uniref:Ankyrin Repeat Protein, variant 2 n=1 Tax=Perkinsus olseni TaxID=32597 RepID=A0A7J6PC12_PEROL|nr:Ankyrin Repeat Protein, variant 2 [Perkinsus olseni]
MPVLWRRMLIAGRGRIMHTTTGSFCAASGGWGDLHLAAATGNLSLVKSLVEKGYDIDERMMDRSTPLHLAAANGWVPVIDYLMEKGASLDVVDVGGLTPLQKALTTQQQKSVQALSGWKAKGVNADRAMQATTFRDMSPDDDSLGRSPVHRAALWRRPDLVRDLLNLIGCDPCHASSSGETAVHVAAELKNEDVLQEIINFVGPSAADVDYPVIVEKCCALEDLLTLQDKSGRRVKDMPGAGLILAAILRGRAYAVDVKRFVRAKYPQLSLLQPSKPRERIPVNINSRDEYGYTALHHAAIRSRSSGCCSSRRNFVKMDKLLQYGADIDARCRLHGATPLHYVAASCDAVALAELLIANGADVNALTSACGETPLHWAVKSASDVHFAMVKALLEAGADPTVQTFRSTTHPRMILPDIKLSAGSTPVHYAVRLRKYGVFAMIVDHIRPSDLDCDPAVRDAKSRGETAVGRSRGLEP